MVGGRSLAWAAPARRAFERLTALVSDVVASLARAAPVRLALAGGLATVLLLGCAPDRDDSGRGGPPVEAVTWIDSRDGPLWLGAPPNSLTVREEVLEAAAAGVAAVRVHGCGPASSGTGFAIAPGLVVASAHLVAGASAVEVEWSPDGVAARRSFGAEVVGFDAGRDLALLRTDAPLTPLEIDRARLGATAAVLGYPRGDELVASPARVEHFVSATGLWGDGTARNAYVLAADVRTGQSGAPLIDSNGRTVGVAFAAARGPREIGFALSRGELLNFLNSTGIDARVDYRGRTVIKPPPAALAAEVPHGTCNR